MAEWLIERGIGEWRALLVDNETVKAAKVFWPGEIYAGGSFEAQLTSRHKGTRRGIATLANSTKILVDHLPPDLSEGKTFHLRISRAPLAEKGRFKLAQGRYVAPDENDLSPTDPLPDGRIVPSFPKGLWSEVWEAAWSGTITFPSGQIIVSPTPAMTLIDIDGSDDAVRTASDAVAAVDQAIRWFDLGGSIGIDFPTIPSKQDRKTIDARIDTALDDWPHERTAMNGFGFVQIVARLEGPSLIHRMTTSRVGMAARMLLRRGEMAQGVGPVLLLTCHPALKAKLKPEWLAELERRSGRTVRVETDPAIAISGGHAQILADG